MAEIVVAEPGYGSDTERSGATTTGHVHVPEPFDSERLPVTLASEIRGVYDAAARTLRGPKVRTNFLIHSSLPWFYCHNNSNDHQFVYLSLARSSFTPKTLERERIQTTKSNQNRIVKTPGGKLVYQTTKKRASGRKRPVTCKRIQGIPHLRPTEFTRGPPV